MLRLEGFERKKNSVFIGLLTLFIVTNSVFMIGDFGDNIYCSQTNRLFIVSEQWRN